MQHEVYKTCIAFGLYKSRHLIEQGEVLSVVTIEILLLHP